jgi:hypothetical protein
MSFVVWVGKNLSYPILFYFILSYLIFQLVVLANGSLSSVHPNPTQLLPILNVAKVGLLKKISLKISVVDLDPDPDTPGYFGPFGSGHDFSLF